VLAGQIEGRDAATFRSRVAALDAREATLTLATTVAGANGAQTETMGLIDRLIAHCPAR